MKCSNCNNDNPEGSKVCGYCGTPFANMTTDSAQGGEQMANGSQFDEGAAQSGNQIYDQQMYQQQGYNQSGYDQQAYNQQMYQQGYTQQGYDQQAYNQQMYQQGYPQQGYNQQGYPQQMYQQPNSVKPPKPPKAPKQPKEHKPMDPAAKKKLIGFGAVAALIVVALIVVSVIINNKRTTIDLADYVTVEFNGYDTMGTASYRINYDALRTEHKGKVKMKSGKHIDGKNNAEMMVYECISGGQLDTTNALTNGDKVLFTWDLDETLADERYRIKFKNTTTVFTVSGLKEVKDINPFDSLDVTYNGIAPNGNASVSWIGDDNYRYYVDYSLDKSSGLSNDDKVTVTVTANNDSLVRDYGVRITEGTQEYTVSGLASYITKLEQIPEDTISKMELQGQDVLKAHVANNWNEHEILDSMQYIGCYLLTPKNGDGYNSNMVDVVYKVSARDSFPEYNVDQSFSYYYFVRFYNVMILEDGTCSVDLSSYDTPGERFDRRVEYTDEDGYDDYSNFYYYGYEKLDSLFSDCVTRNIDTYNYESSVSEE